MTEDSAVKKSEEKSEDESKNPLSDEGDEASVANSDSIEEKVSEISEKEEK